MDSVRNEETITPAAVTIIGVCTLAAATLWALGIRETVGLLLAGDRTVWLKTLTFAGLIVLGDVVGTKISDVPRHNLWQTLQRAAVTAVAGFVLALNARTLITGVSVLVPKVGVWSLSNLLRAVLLYGLGAVFVSACYSLFVPGYFARKIIRENQPDTAAELLPKYTLRRQIIKTWNGVKGRWMVVLANYWYMNLLPWGWLTPDIGFGIVTCGINVYLAFKSTSKALNAPFLQRIVGQLRHGKQHRACEIGEM